MGLHFEVIQKVKLTEDIMTVMKYSHRFLGFLKQPPDTSDLGSFNLGK